MQLGLVVALMMWSCDPLACNPCCGSSDSKDGSLVMFQLNKLSRGLPAWGRERVRVTQCNKKKMWGEEICGDCTSFGVL